MSGQEFGPARSERDDERGQIRAWVRERAHAVQVGDAERVATIDEELERLGVRRVPPPGGREHVVMVEWPQGSSDWPASIDYVWPDDGESEVR